MFLLEHSETFITVLRILLYVLLVVVGFFIAGKSKEFDNKTQFWLLIYSPVMIIGTLIFTFLPEGIVYVLTNIASNIKN